MLNKDVFFHNLAHDPHHTLDGLSCMQCIFCNMAVMKEGRNDYLISFAMVVMKEGMIISSRQGVSCLMEL